MYGLGAWIRYTGMTIAKEMKSVYILLSCSATALQSIHLFQSHCSLFSCTHPCLYIFTFSL